MLAGMFGTARLESAIAHAKVRNRSSEATEERATMS
jgi:hypothetical protein